MILCSLVFQHIPRKRGEKIFARLVELLSDNGVAAIQFLYYREVSTLETTMGFLRKKIPLLHYFVNLLYGKPFFDPLMEKNVYDLNRLLAILDGCGNLHLRFLGNRELRSVILFFQKTRDEVPCDL